MTVRAWLIVGSMVLGLAGAQQRASAQATDTTRARVAGDSAKVPTTRPATSRPVGTVVGRFTPPITPRRAFVYSAMLPGFGQSKLDRGSSGALFAAVELAALVMVRRSFADLREARRFRADSLPSNFTVDGDTVVRAGLLATRYDEDLIRTRRLHVEDWLAVIAFNHLFSGADAFVAAQLWDVPLKVSALPSRRGTFLVATIAF